MVESTAKGSAPGDGTTLGVTKVCQNLGKMWVKQISLVEAVARPFAAVAGQPKSARPMDEFTARRVAKAIVSGCLRDALGTAALSPVEP